LKDRILFWLDSGLHHFGIAKFFLEKYDCDSFAIIDTDNNLKNFFLRQNLVKFQKVWYFREYVSNIKQKPNLEYLVSFEKKYKIDLWQLAYSERIFFQFNEYYKFSQDEILFILEQECRFFESVLEEVKPNFLFIRLTDLHRMHLLHQMCKAQDVKILMLSTTRFGYRATLSTDFDKIDNLNTTSMDHPSQKKTVEELEEYIKKSSIYQQITNPYEGGIKLSKWKVLMRHLRFLQIISDKKYRDFYEHFGVTPKRALTKEDFLIPYLIKRWYRGSFLHKNSIYEVDENTPFVYYPLHVEPERTLSLTAPFYTNQLEIITHIAKSLPVGYELYVKENYNMSSKPWRRTSFYKTILDLPNVRLIHPSVKPDVLMKNCSLVITISGTSGLEAAFYKKPSITFAELSYSYLPFVFTIKNIEDLPQIIGTCLEQKFDFSSLNKYIDLIIKNSFEFDWGKLDYVISEHLFKYKGMRIDEDISESKMDNFLKKFSSTFEHLALEHIKKIEQHKINLKNKGFTLK